MDVAISGASGLVGSALRASLEADGHTAISLVRSGGHGASGPTIAWDPVAGTIDARALEGVDAVVHLAGEGIAAGRWTDEHLARVRDSRTKGTSLIAGALARLDRPPSVLVSGSAIGYYGDRGDELLDERSAPGTDLLGGLCVAWEAAAEPAAAAGIRVARIRTGIVLSTEGGALAKQLLPFKLGLGGKAGSGRQWLSWITLADEVRAIRFLLDHDVAGPVDLTAPNPVTQATFARALGHALHRPTVVPIPRFVGKLPFGIGPLAETLLFSSARVAPTVLEDAGFTFTATTIDEAFAQLLGRRHEQAG